MQSVFISRQTITSDKMEDVVAALQLIPSLKSESTFVAGEIINPYSPNFGQ